MRRYGLWLLAVVGLWGCPDSSKEMGDPLLWDGYRFPYHDIDRFDAMADSPQDSSSDTGYVACSVDSDCPLGQVCDPKLSVCVECYLHAQCRPGELCLDGKCKEHTKCSVDEPCENGLICDEELGVCVQCSNDDDCGEGFICDKYECLPRPPCDDDSDCPPPMVCSAHLGVCVECLTDSDCTLAAWCEVDPGLCQPDVCSPGDKECVTGGFKICLDNGSAFGDLITCPDGTYCKNGECIQITVCIPGESVCLSTSAYRVCAEDGNSWSTVDCSENETCIDLGDNHAQCKSGCVPDCSGIPVNACGPEPCGTICDKCTDLWTCGAEVFGLEPGQYVKCVPQCSCDGIECGSDACGNTCGYCPDGEICVSGMCQYEGLSCGQVYECSMGCFNSVSMIDQGCVDNCVAQSRPEDQIKITSLLSCILNVCGSNPTYDCVVKATDDVCRDQFVACTTCVPDCFGIACGDDGCGGSCGDCGPYAECLNGTCVGTASCLDILECLHDSNDPDIVATECVLIGGPEAQQAFFDLYNCVVNICGSFSMESACYQNVKYSACKEAFDSCITCQPNCLGRECGPDGCGGTCGTCQTGWDCDTGECVCIPDCAGKECGSDGCGGLCGVCFTGFNCTPQGKCQCTPNCVARECGNDGCGGTCGYCQPNSQCTDAGSCLPLICQPGQMECDGNMRLICPPDGGNWVELGLCEPGTWCVNGLCKPNECSPGEKRCEGNAVSICDDSGMGWLPPELCPAQTTCTNGVCVPMSGCGNVPAAGCCDGDMAMYCIGNTVVVESCGTVGCGWVPQKGYRCGGSGADPSGVYPLECSGSCVPECAGKQCGADGCGGTCGSCSAGFQCSDGLCSPICVPNCQGKTCGSDGCGGVCGICDGSKECIDGVCITPPTCADMVVCMKQCYSQGQQCFDACSKAAPAGELADFSAIWQCVSGKCSATAPATCIDQALLGSCYNQYLICISCTPSCANKVCGSDGCGGSCGSCPTGQQCLNGGCQPVCVPSCSGKQCGDNGCGGTCGLCPSGYLCEGGKCVWPCVPACNGKECGADGCGGSCGFCDSTEYCTTNGQCLPSIVCGDNKCDTALGETCMTCPSDCGVCTDGCTASVFPGCSDCKCEDCVCAKDPYCCNVQWDSVCVDMCKSCGGCACTPACVGKQCGPDGCGNTCGTCPAGTACDNGKCTSSCIPSCEGKQCGDNGCGGVCGTCPVGQTCKDSVCFQGMSCAALVNCAMQCVGQSGAECLYDCLEQGTPEAQSKFFTLTQCILGVCGTSLDYSCLLNSMKGACVDQYNQCLNCTPSCAGKQCGPDGCGGSCGTCPTNAYCDNYQCKSICQPNCEGKQCGDDGCGGSCGSCPAGNTCTAGKCVPVCVPNCTGKQCGSDGCGGTCGNCPYPLTCSIKGLCEPATVVCGNGACETQGGETCSTCPKDCGQCSNGCVESQSPGCGGCSCEQCVCAKDPFCCQAFWDSLCVQECQDCGGCGCLPSCAGKQCGPDGCGGLCGTCPPGMTCQNGTCLDSCQPSCIGKQCGSDGCGGSCGKCPDGFVCSAQGFCKPSCVPDCAGRECGPDGCNGICGLCGPQEACVSGTCQTAWDCGELLNCYWDCPNGDEACNTACWQNASPEAQNQFIKVLECVTEVCGEPASDSCVSSAIYGGPCKDEFNSCLDCTPACTGKQCGSDGCGGSCGTCPTGYECDIYGYCDCTPSCNGRDCGNDGCNGSCGECEDGFVCSQYGKCVCLPQCYGAQCGPDGCGGQCGTCPSGYQCVGNLCQPYCVPKCDDKECGPDGCGGQCGYCPPGTQCQADGWCGPAEPVCGDGYCDTYGGESCLSCPIDCGSCSGSCCEAQQGPGCQDALVMNCVCEQDPYCCQAVWDQICVNEVTSLGCGTCGCQPQCVGKECGSDGCGGTCGFCKPGTTCNTSGMCVASCVPQCFGKQCGSNGCGGSCGTCPSGTACNSQGLCIPTCQPSCSGKQCGSDGCGGSCGTCVYPSSCNSQGMCVCVPQCTGKACGPDGCGGSCGQCSGWQTCTSSGQCDWVGPMCGNGTCNSWMNENCDTCPKDCGSCCGNGTCESKYSETCLTCPTDCGFCCGNGFCEANQGETCETCAEDCGTCPATCGDGVCDESRGETCETCQADCGPCYPTCGDGTCGSDETCTSCPLDCICSDSCCVQHAATGCLDPDVMQCVCAADSYCCSVQWDSYCASLADSCGSCTGMACEAHDNPGADDEAIEECVCAYMPDCCLYYWSEECVWAVEAYGCGKCQGMAICGDGVCSSGEDCQFCPKDCGECCGNGMCDEWLGESCDNCEPDCGPCQCEPDCENKMCGSDGCGGTCGTCPNGFTCTNGICQPGTGELTCAQALDCANGCSSDWNCFLDCYNQGSPEAKSLFMNLMSCVAGVCGLPPDSSCMYFAFMGSCYSQYNECASN